MDDDTPDRINGLDASRQRAYQDRIKELEGAVLESCRIAEEFNDQALHAEKHAKLVTSALVESEEAREMALGLSAELQSRINELEAENAKLEAKIDSWLPLLNLGVGG